MQSSLKQTKKKGKKKQLKKVKIPTMHGGTIEIKTVFIYLYEIWTAKLDFDYGKRSIIDSPFGFGWPLQW